MSKSYVKSLKEYKGQTRLDEKKILDSMKRLKRTKKLPTSVALEATTVRELKSLASHKGVPYQVLMRMFIVEGLRRTKR
jgi:predicted DNA binding CopG/RHH family protein